MPACCGLGLEDHDRELFDRGAEQLREFVGFVKDIGFLVMPVCVLSACADDQVRRAMEAAVASGKVKAADLPKCTGLSKAECDAMLDASDVTPIVPMNPVSMGCAMVVRRHAVL